jgi:hypothetical protein
MINFMDSVSYTEENNKLILSASLERETTAIPCPICNGYCDEHKLTKDEIKKYDCGKGHQCCATVFICRICKKRIIAHLDAPEFI